MNLWPMGRGAAAKSRLGLQGADESDECDWVQARIPNLGHPRCCSCSYSTDTRYIIHIIQIIVMHCIEDPNPMIWLVGGEKQRRRGAAPADCSGTI